ncbi:DUF262 domain-containing protein [Uliginosibacterium sp. 31-12]|uniref:DUF262 domain-containing protein n=1 Tax=Uliginosibacterium sp. 31-12 TaxID=3062781 RepID=UPI0026E247C8|nr:DUF262 domain-containing protein [Uliginosibacterium sp. 31-12]MDO6384688.1 DUF262 domain-containing protein [Uliginosibacterium sp. 31-12]
MSKDDHKIDADDRCIFDVLNERKYTVDYFQREYSWEKKHIEQLVTDLSATFLDVYQDGDARTAVEHYNNYYLGPFVVSSKDGARSIIDGQQRLTSLTLLLIFLNNLQKELGGKESIEPLVFSEKYGKKSFNIQVDERMACLEKLFLEGCYEVQPGDDESTVNMADRYMDIKEAFPEELKGAAFPYFLDWLKYNVILVEITAYSDDNAYTIFESMNDRGLNLTATEMLKSYILSRFSEQKSRDKANTFWKGAIQSLHAQSKEEDQRFIQAWFRSQYADTIRQGKAGSSNEDFEKIGTRFHNWFRDNLSKAKLKANSTEDFQKFIHTELKFYLQAYLNILDAQKEEKPGWERVFYHSHWGVADSLSLPLMLAPLISSDDAETARLKINMVAQYLETFAVRRAINFRNFGASSIRYTMYSLVKEIRGKDLLSLREALGKKLEEMPEKWNGLAQFRMHGQNRHFVKFLLSRITGYSEQRSGHSNNFSSYFIRQGDSKPFEVEHIWADKFDQHRDEFDQQHEFDAYRNRIGDLLLLPRGTNQSYGAMAYADKVKHYLKENLLAKSLHPQAYENNPNFLNMIESLELKFKAHAMFQKADIDARQQLIQQICERIWVWEGQS